MKTATFPEQAIKTRSAIILFLIIFMHATCCLAGENEENSKTASVIQDNKDQNHGRNILRTEDINKMNVSDVRELLNKVPGVTTDNMKAYIRGSSEVLVILDGRKINDPVSRSVKWDQISLNNIEKIEIIKGGGSAEYGENASGGVILITSKSGENLNGSLEAYGGNYSTISFNSDINTIVGAVGLGTSLGYYSTDGFLINNEKESVKAEINLSYSPEPDISFFPSFSYFNEEKGLSGSIVNPSPYNDAFYESFSAILGAKIKGINSKTLFSDVVDRSTDSPLSTAGPHNVKVHPKTFNQELSTGFTSETWGNFISGIGYEYITIDVEKNINYMPYAPETHKDKKGWIFTTYKKNIRNSPLSLYMGLRGIYYNNFDNSLNPEIKLEYITKKYGLVFGFNMNDNLPTIHRRYRQDSLFLASPDLKKESSMNYSATFFFNPLQTVFFSVSPYYSVVDDIIVTNPTPAGLQSLNADKATLKGTDTSITWGPSEKFDLSLSYTYLEAKDDQTGNYLPGKPKHTAQVKAVVIPLENLSANLTWSYTSSQFNNRSNTISVDKYNLFDCRVEYKLEKYILFAQVKNILDEEYLSYIRALQWPRNWIAGIKYSF